MKLYFPEIVFSAAHYIPNHESCGGIHGHSYVIKDLTIDIGVPVLDENGMSMDFGAIKGYFKQKWDHKLFLPQHTAKFGRELIAVLGKMGVNHWNIRYIDGTTAELMATLIKADIESMFRYQDVKVGFKLFEGPHQAIQI